MLITACHSNSNRTSATTTDSVKKTDSVNIKAPATDSGKLVWHLDSLSKIKFPYELEANGRTGPNIDLSEFKNSKSFFCIRYKPIPTLVGGGTIDMDVENGISEYYDATFDLVDTPSYRSEWALIARTPKFVVIRLYGDEKLVTLNYQFKVIDAITAAARQGNNHWTSERTATINQDLTIVLHHQYSVQTDAQYHMETSDEGDQYWYIDVNGYFRKQHTKRHKRI